MGCCRVQNVRVCGDPGPERVQSTVRGPAAQGAAGGGGGGRDVRPGAGEACGRRGLGRREHGAGTAWGGGLPLRRRLQGRSLRPEARHTPRVSGARRLRLRQHHGPRQRGHVPARSLHLHLPLREYTHSIDPSKGSYYPRVLVIVLTYLEPSQREGQAKRGEHLFQCDAYCFFDGTS